MQLTTLESTFRIVLTGSILMSNYTERILMVAEADESDQREVSDGLRGGG